MINGEGLIGRDRGFSNLRALPLLLIGKLAIDVRFQGQGLMQIILFAAYQIILNSWVGGMGAVIEGKSPVLVAAYVRKGFRPLPGNGTMLVKPLANIREELADT